MHVPAVVEYLAFLQYVQLSICHLTSMLFFFFYSVFYWDQSFYHGLWMCCGIVICHTAGGEFNFQLNWHVKYGLTYLLFGPIYIYIYIYIPLYSIYQLMPVQKQNKKIAMKV